MKGRDFGVGDVVRVLSGQYSGQCGFVVRVGTQQYGKPAKPFVTVRLRRKGRWYHIAFAPQSLDLMAPFTPAGDE